jgi:hypothetical protein
MAEYTDRERFIPYRKAEVVDLLCDEGSTRRRARRRRFRAFCKVLESLYHFEFHGQLEKMKEHYFPFNPDRDTKTQTGLRREGAARDTKKSLDGRVRRTSSNGANYETITDAELQNALEEESLFRISLFVDFNGLLAHGAVPPRGRREEGRDHRVVLPQEDHRRADIRACGAAGAFQGQAPTSKRRARRPTEEVRRAALRAGSMVLKLFKDVPKADLEMLFPNTEVTHAPAGLGACCSRPASWAAPPCCSRRRCPSAWPPRWSGH